MLEQALKKSVKDDKKKILNKSFMRYSESRKKKPAKYYHLLVKISNATVGKRINHDQTFCETKTN
jgi:hypothetical protein